MKPEKERDANPEDEQRSCPADQDAWVCDPDVGDPALEALGESLTSLEKLRSLASGGDRGAVTLLHRITCQLTDELNAHHPDLAESTVEWPLLMAADRETRLTQADSALRMNIGGTQARRRGRPSKNDYESERGFALTNLKRLAWARSILQMLRFDEDPQGFDEEAAAHFADLTEITNHNASLLTSVVSLPTYSATSREQWITVLVEILKSNLHLCPEGIENNSFTVHRPPETLRGRIPAEVEWRGGLLKKTLNRALKNVNAIPGFPVQ